VLVLVVAVVVVDDFVHYQDQQYLDQLRRAYIGVEDDSVES
jgi:hypothetical protein